MSRVHILFEVVKRNEADKLLKFDMSGAMSDEEQWGLKSRREFVLKNLQVRTGHMHMPVHVLNVSCKTSSILATQRCHEAKIEEVELDHSDNTQWLYWPKLVKGFSL